jgi:uncharacterized membrane protein YeaQ/YmgE (transglycosylase-associated protein family)
MDWSSLIVVCLIFGAIGAAITQRKNRSPWEGFMLGVLLNLIGVVIAAVLPKLLPKAPPGMSARKCPRCNAVQNVAVGQPDFECWQCHTVAPTGYPAPPPAPGPPQALVVADTGESRKVKCYQCEMVQDVPAGVELVNCVSCKAPMRV